MCNSITKRIAAYLLLLVFLAVFAVAVYVRLNRFAAERMNLIALVEIGDPDAVDYVLRWDPEQASERGLRYMLEIDPALAGDERLVSTAYEYTPLGLAVVLGHRRIAERLLSAGVDPNAASVPGGTPLQLAAAYNRPRIAALLIASGARVSSPNDFTQGPLSVALGAGHEEVAKVLMERGAQLDLGVQGPSLLLNAASRGFADLAADLLTRGVNPEVTNTKGETPLHLAVRNGHRSVVKQLLTHGASVNTTRRGGLTALHLAIMRSDPALVKLLLERGADVDQPDSDGWTPLHYAVSQPKMQILELLLAKDPDVNAPDKSGRRPLDYAADAMATRLKDRGAVKTVQRVEDEELNRFFEALEKEK